MVLRESGGLDPLIRAAGWSPTEFAAVAGINRQTLWRIRTGRQVSDDTASKVTAALGPVYKVDRLFRKNHPDGAAMSTSARETRIEGADASEVTV